MDARASWSSQDASGDIIRRQVWLLGQPPLQSYLDFVEDMTLGGAEIAPLTLVDEWRAANDYYGELEQTEAGIADEVEIRDLDPALQSLTEAIMADPRHRRTFDTLPTRFAMVELDRLLVGHPFVSLHHVERLKTRIGHSATPEAVFSFCLPLDRPEAPVEMLRVGPRRFVFWSESTDFRFQEAVFLRPDQFTGFEPFGPLAGGVGLMVGYGSNFLNVIQSDTRLLLHNGHHRAYALRDLGYTHAPCIVQTVTRVEELKLIATRAVRDDPVFYFAAARPPLLKDFFDPKIRKVLRVRKIVGMVEVNFEVNELRTRDFASSE